MKTYKLLILALLVIILSNCRQTVKKDTQENITKYKIGVANYGAHPILDVIVESYKSEMKILGYNDSNTVTIWKSVEGDINLSSQVAQSLLNEGCDVIISITTPISQAVKKVAIGKVPIVFCGVTDPISAGLVESWGNSPESGITGTSDRWPYKEQIELIRKLCPNAKKVGFPYNSGESNSLYALDQIKPIIKENNLELLTSVATNIGEVRKSVEFLINRGAEVIYVSSDNTIMSGFESILKLSYERKIPVIVGESANVERGGLATFSVNYKELGKETAKIVDKILKGVKPGSIPVKTFKGENLYINLKAADLMDVKIPQEMIKKAIIVNK